MVDDNITTKLTQIFYFSASGNSLALTGDIAKKIFEILSLNSYLLNIV